MRVVNMLWFSEKCTENMTENSLLVFKNIATILGLTIYSVIVKELYFIYFFLKSYS